MNDFAQAHKEVGEAINNMATAMDKNAKNIDNLRKLIRDLEITKAKAKLTLSKVNEKVIELKNKAEGTIGEETEVIQNDYDESMTELIREFVKDIRHTHTKNLDSIKDEFGYLSGLKESFLEDAMDLNQFQQLYYENRKKQLFSSKMSVLTTIEDFLTERESIKRRIENLKVKVPIREPMTFLYPFWIIGFEDEYNKEEYVIQPIMNKYPPRGTPSEETPYIEHLTDHTKFSLTKENFSPHLWQRLVNSSDIGDIDRFSILPNIKIYIDEMEELANQGYYSHEFFEMLLSFYKDGQYSPRVSPYLSYGSTQDYLPRRPKYGRISDIQENAHLQPPPPRIIPASGEYDQDVVQSLPTPRPPRITPISSDTEHSDRINNNYHLPLVNEESLEWEPTKTKMLPERIDDGSLVNIFQKNESDDIEWAKVKAKEYNERLFKIFQKAISQGIEIREFQMEYELAVKDFQSGDFFSSLEKFEQVENALISVINFQLENRPSSSRNKSDVDDISSEEKREKAMHLMSSIEEDIIKEEISTSTDPNVNESSIQSAEMEDALRLIRDIEEDILTDSS